MGSLRRESKCFRRSLMNDSSTAAPAAAPGRAQSVSPTVLSTSRDDSVSCQSTGWGEPKGQAEVTAGSGGAGSPGLLGSLTLAARAAA